MQRPSSPAARWPPIVWITIPLCALLACSGILLHGNSCGHDISFHIHSWLDAASQMRHGKLYPQWAFAPAFHGGEPRFVFYPPLSWMYGALLSLVFPFEIVPLILIVSICAAAGFSMYAVARRFAAPHAALLAACAYLANPYMLYNAFERAAYAELAASIAIPLLLLATLCERPTITLAACSVAVLWLTNVPAGIMATYTFAALALLRLAHDLRTNNRSTTKRNVLTLAAGLALGLLLPAAYLLPAAIEKRFVSTELLNQNDFSPSENFLFSEINSPHYTTIKHQLGIIAVVLLAVAAVGLFLHWVRNRASLAQRRLALATACTSLAILWLLIPASAIAWRFAPELALLQFPWRWLTLLSAFSALALALGVDRFPLRVWIASCLGIVLAATASFVCYRNYAQGCDMPRAATHERLLFNTGHGSQPQDEYTPEGADNDTLRSNDPAFWLAPANNPNFVFPGTVLIPAVETGDYDAPIPESITNSATAPSSFTVSTAAPSTLVLNLREFPRWDVSLRCDGASCTSTKPFFPPHIRRTDGLIAVPLSPGSWHVEIAWHRAWENWTGDALSLFALLTLLFLRFRSRKINL